MARSGRQSAGAPDRAYRVLRQCRHRFQFLLHAYHVTFVFRLQSLAFGFKRRMGRGQALTLLKKYKG